MMKLYEKALLAIAFLLMALGPIEAQERLKLDFYTRFDYNFLSTSENANGEESGFAGRFLMVRAEGNLGNGFSYAISHRLNKINKDIKAFNSTDWAYLTYTTKDGGWDFSAGKVVQWVGAYEYDDNPIDIPFLSNYSSRCNPYLLGAIAGKIFSPNDRLSLICTTSPYDTPEKNLLAYALEWRGHHGCWHPIYTFNISEQEIYGPSYLIGLGNKFELGKWELKYDHLQRFCGEKSSWKHLDFSASCLVRYRLTDHWTLFGKTTCDINDNEVPFDLTVSNGTNNRLYGAGVEFFPDKERNIKLYGMHIRSLGEYANIPNDFSRTCIGLKWKVNMITLK